MGKNLHDEDDISEFSLSPLRVDLDADGLSIIFKDWEKKLIHYLLNIRECSSRDAFLYMNKDEKTISRASIIFFFNKLVNFGFMDYDVVTSKGGYKRVYGLGDSFQTEKDIMREIYYRIESKLNHVISQM